MKRMESVCTNNLGRNHKNCRIATNSLNLYSILPEPAEFEGERAFRVGKIGLDVEMMHIVVEKAACLCLVQEAGVCCKHVHLVLLSDPECMEPSARRPPADADYDTPSSPPPRIAPRIATSSSRRLVDPSAIFRLVAMLGFKNHRLRQLRWSLRKMSPFVPFAFRC